jgi:hypothetical protein
VTREPALAPCIFSCGLTARTHGRRTALLFWRGTAEDWPLQLENFQSRQASHLQHTTDQLNNAVLEMAVEIPMDERIIRVPARILVSTQPYVRAGMCR